MACNSSTPTSPRAMNSSDLLIPIELWVPNTLTDDLKDMLVRDILPKKVISGWKCYYCLEFPSED